MTAVGDALVIAHPGDPLHGEQLAVLLAGPALYLLGHVAFELRMTAVPPTRLGAALVVVALAPLAAVLPVVATWALVYVTLAAVAGLETYARLWGRPEGEPPRGWPLAEGRRTLPALRLRRVLKSAGRPER